MVIYTSYFGNLENLPKNLVKISIARYSDSFPNIPRYEPLMPSKSLLFKIKKGIIGEFMYAKLFNQHLYSLDMEKVISDLVEIAGENDIVLLCYETPDKFCHRKLIAKWFMGEFVECIEYGGKRISRSEWLRDLGVTEKELIDEDEFDID